MNLKRIALIMMVICVGLVPLAALTEGTSLDQAVPLLNAATGAAISQNVDHWHGEPSDAISYAALLRLAAQFVQKGEWAADADGTCFVPAEQLQTWYHLLFSEGSFKLPSDDVDESISLAENGLCFNIKNVDPLTAGVVPMLAEPSAGGMKVICELYISDDAGFDPDVSHINDAQWIGMGEFLLAEAPDSPYGYSLVSYSRVIDDQVENPLAMFFSEELGLSFAYPSELAPYLVVEPNEVQACLPNDELSVHAMVEENSGQSLEDWARRLREAYTGSLVSLYQDAGYFTLTYEINEHTCYRIVSVTDSAMYQVEIRFLTHLDDLYGMFAEYLENSFTVYEFAVG